MRASGGRSPGRRSVHRAPDTSARSGRAPAPPPSPLECPPRKPARRTRGAAPRPRVPRPAPPATPRRFARTGRDRRPAPARALPVTTASPLAATGRSGAERSGSNGSTRPRASSSASPSPRLASATGGASTSSTSSVPGSRRPTSTAVDAGHGVDPARERRGIVEHAGLRARASARRSPSPDQDTAIRRSPPASPGRSRVRRSSLRQPEPEREPEREAAEQLPAGLQAAPSHRTSSGPTRVMSPAPSVRTTSPGRERLVDPAPDLRARRLEPRVGARASGRVRHLAAAHARRSAARARRRPR